MEKTEIFNNLALCIQRGKIDINSKHPADYKTNRGQ